jgi:hypothetical protein
MHYRWQNRTLLLYCHIQPNARSDEFCGLHGERLKIRLRAAPLAGQANQHLLRYLAAAFGVPRADVSIVRGSSSRRKDLAIKQPARLPPQCQIDSQ